MTCVDSPSVSMFSLRLLVRTENGQLKRFDYACMYIRRCRCVGDVLVLLLSSDSLFTSNVRMEYLLVKWKELPFVAYMCI